MVIADAESPGPLRKRPRLSLRFPKAVTSQKDRLSGPGKKDESQKETRELSGETEEVQELSMNDDIGYNSEKEEKVVPAVSSLENLGNTCFLNSVLQVLRYTPGFLDGLDDLHGEILFVEKWQKQDTASKELHEDLSYELSQSQTCDMMKHLHKLYKFMDRREVRHSEVASSDVMSMALKPDKILNTLRELNPMFEGNLQHDAQELLRCMLCYLQDAFKEIKKIKSRLPPSALPQSKGPLNPIMQKFLSNGKSERNDLKQDVPNHVSIKKEVQLPAVEVAKSFPKTDFLDEIEKSESAKTASSEETMDVAEADIPDFTVKVGVNKDQDADLDTDSKQGVVKGNISAVPKRLRSKRTQPPSSVKKTREKMSEKLDETDGDPLLRRRKGGRKSTEKDAADDKSQIKTEKDATSNSSARCKSKGLTNGSANGEVKCEEDQPDSCGTKCSSQPSILSMLTGEKPCKRLGMRGASMKNNQNNSSCNGPVGDNRLEKTSPDIHLSKESLAKSKKRKVLTAFGERTQPVDASNVTSSINNSNSPPSKERTKSQKEQVNKVDIKQEVSEKDSSHLSSEFQKMKCENVANSPDKHKRQPLLKLEKCDHVCDSPKKSVNAEYAEQTLSPMKMSNSSKSTVMVGNAKHKLDFSHDKSRCVTTPPGKLCVKPPLSKVDFVENLFMGKMMLRTKCLECEFSRERIEEFHDISVPLKKEKGDNDDDEDEDMDSDEEDNSCLKKMMDAFAEVERLRDENKYYCDNCIRHVEAERSLHYEVLPDVLSLHLKRFSASSGLYGYVSKINDHVTIPLSLPCLRYKCPSPCSRPDHRYMLYGLVTHAGVTMTSGHYLSYVRVLGNGQPKLGASDSPSSCKDNNLSSRSGFFRSALGENKRSGLGTKYPSVPKQMYEEQWLECDDETIRMYSKQEFCNLLKGEGGSLLGTPYVLFYHRVIPGVHW
ncbi:ubiquitin carboxyl-terminal hydrolase 1-like [Mizuhopecten yessoensis]|uniref:Ubiquitin carboxyl-terminal hydrolase 1 n=1 Tax=Mizuhopecten yessoensis TaxID=6573 RepID=A0A210PVW2_MIZYE|nr:ubiquitin carboxyl-terminal hydrolase 1-like [Mizuhopecten yessoensis]OWF40614.1 Ubiquitin carboxyl-terminal hydrolase 1 [Mizuhopecten yessoensis]